MPAHSVHNPFYMMKASALFIIHARNMKLVHSEEVWWSASLPGLEQERMKIQKTQLNCCSCGVFLFFFVSFLVKSELFNPSSAAAIFVNSPTRGRCDEKAPARASRWPWTQWNVIHFPELMTISAPGLWMESCVRRFLLLLFYVLFCSSLPALALPPINLRAGWVGRRV